MREPHVRQIFTIQMLLVITALNIYKPRGMPRTGGANNTSIAVIREARSVTSAAIMDNYGCL